MQLEGKKKKRQVCYANFPDNWINLQNLEICTVGLGIRYICLYFLGKMVFLPCFELRQTVPLCMWHGGGML